MEIEKYQEQYKKEFNKKRYTQQIFAIIILAVYGLAKYYSVFNSEKLNAYLTPLNIPAFGVLAFVWKYKFAGGIKCPRCQHPTGHQMTNKARFHKRCCGGCGLLLRPEIELHNAKQSLVGEQTIRPGFLNGLAFLGFVLTGVGFYLQEQMFIIGGLGIAGFIFFLKLILPLTNCKSCGNPKPTELKFCEYCGVSGHGGQ